METTQQHRELAVIKYCSGIQISDDSCIAEWVKTGDSSRLVSSTSQAMIAYAEGLAMGSAAGYKGYKEGVEQTFEFIVLYARKMVGLKKKKNQKYVLSDLLAEIEQGKLYPPEMRNDG